jgi:hypothetical protein
MLGLGSYGKVFSPNMVSLQSMLRLSVPGPVTSTSKENVGACKGYDSPDFKPVLPKIGQRMMVTGRYLIEMTGMPGGITELHPVSDIKIILLNFLKIG